MTNFDEIVYVGPRQKDGQIEIMSTQSGEYVSCQLSWSDGRKTSDGKKSYTNIGGISFLQRVVDRFKPDQQGQVLIQSGDRARVQGELQSNNYTGQDGKTVYGYQVNISDIRLVEKRQGQTQQTQTQTSAQGNGNLPQPTGYVQNQATPAAPVPAPQAVPTVPQPAPAPAAPQANPMPAVPGFGIPTTPAAPAQGFSIPAAPQANPMPAVPGFGIPTAPAAPAQGFSIPAAPQVTPNIPTIQGIGGMPLQNMAK